MKHLLIGTHEVEYPEVIVMDCHEDICIVRDVLMFGYTDWDGTYVNNGYDVEVFTLSDTRLTTKTWSSIRHIPATQGMEFL